MQELRSHIRLLAGLACVVAALGAFTVFGTSAVARLAELRDCKRVLTDRAFRLLQENEDLREQITKFHQDDNYLESLARSQLGLVRDREIVYQFSEAGGADDAPPSPPSSPASGLGLR